MDIILNFLVATFLKNKKETGEIDRALLIIPICPKCNVNISTI